MERTQEKRQKNVQDEDLERELLVKLIKRGVLELKPRLSNVGVHYIEAEKTLETDDSTQVRDVIKNLERKGALVAQFLDRVLLCPECGSPEVFSKYACPRCSSINVEFTELLEHMECGYMGSKDNFLEGSSLVCPRCQTELFDDALQYRMVGDCCRCEKCGHCFDTPEVIHICQQCKRSFTHREAKYIKIFAYKISEEITNEFMGELPLFESVEEIFHEKHYDTQFRTQLTGESGVQHPFDIVAKRESVLLVVDVSLAGEKKDAVSLLGKKTDVKPTECMIIDLSDRDELPSLGKIYGITILKGGNEKKLRKDLRNVLDRLNLMYFQ